MIRICKECGKAFETTSSRRLFCYDKHYRICECCGNTFYVPFEKLNSPIKTCSESCRRKIISKKWANRPAKYECTCEFCGKKFYSKKKNARICNNPHYKICPVCGKRFELSKSAMLRGVKTCSKECRYKLSHETYMENYGKDTNPENYNLMINKFKNTCLDKYGVENPMQDKDIVKKAQHTCLEKYGVMSYAQTDEFKDDVKSKNQEKYGTDWGMQSEEWRKQSKETCLKKYGVDNPSKSKDIIEDRMTNPDKISELMEFRNNPRLFIQQNFENTPTLSELSKILGIRDSSVAYILKAEDCNDIIAHAYSCMEQDIYSFLLSIIPENEIQRNTSKIITPYELDIYIPKYKLAIECNPTSTHNSTVGIWGGVNTDSKSTNAKSIQYHKMKTDMCKTKGVFLFHLFGYNWKNKQDICKSILSEYLNASTVMIDASETVIKAVDLIEAKNFLLANSLYGYVNSSIRYGLYYNDDLVSLIGFRKAKKSNSFKNNNNACYNLTVFCNKQNTCVVNGEDKLLRYFIFKYNPYKISIILDRAHIKDTFYKDFGFVETRITSPKCMWVNIKNDTICKKSDRNKSNIRTFLNDDSIDLSNSEQEIMESHKYVRVYDSGNSIFEYINQNYEVNI